MQTIKDFLRGYNIRETVPTLEAMQKMVIFSDNKGFDMLKFACSLPNLANICLHCATNANFYPFTESHKDFLLKVWEYLVAGPSIVFTRQVVVDETHIRKSTNVCKSIVRIDASQLYPDSMCQSMPTGFCKRYEFDADLQRLKPQQNKSRSFQENSHVVRSTTMKTGL